MARKQDYLRYVRTTDAATEPVSSSEFKTFARIDGTDEDTLITALLKTARQMAEDYCERSFITQTWKLYGNNFPDEILLPRGKAISITSVKYSTTTALDSTFTDYNASLQNDIGVIVPTESVTWPDTESEFPNSLEVIYTAGYGANASDVPEAIKTAIKLICSDLFENRQSFSEKRVSPVGYYGKPTWQFMLDPYKIHL